MPQFTPSDRETVKEYVEDQPFVHTVSPAGRALEVVKKTEHSVENNPNLFTGLMERHGWYPSTVTFYEDGTRYTLAPVTEAANDT